MSEERLILLSECAIRLGVDTTFILRLEDTGLIKTVRVEREVYIDIIQLPELERVSRLYRELEINVEGIEAIAHLLQRIKSLQDEILLLEID